MSLAKHLRGMRVARGMSLRQWARCARLNPSALSRWGSGVTLPRVYELRAVLNALRASEVERARIWHQLQAPRAVMHSTAEDRESFLPAALPQLEVNCCVPSDGVKVGPCNRSPHLSG